MALRKILVPLSGRFDPDDPESLDRPALEIGLWIGKEYGAHVEVFCVAGPPPDPDRAVSAWLPGYAAVELVRMIEAEGEACLKRARASFAASLKSLEVLPVTSSNSRPGFSVNFVEHVGEIRESVGARGRLADLVVIANSPERWRWRYRPILDAALRDTGRPLFVSPPKAPPNLGRRIAIAWNGSIEASRAVAVVLNFIRPGAQVVIMSVKADGPLTPGIEDVADYLRWHGVESKTLELQGDARSSGDVIVRRALTSNCDLLVMGACIHSRAHCVVFGSMTETVLSRAEIPALIVT